MNMNMNMNISIGLRIAASACRRFLTSLYTIHAHAQMEQIFQSIYATVIIVLSQCRCLPPGVEYCPGKAANRRKETRPEEFSRISFKQLLRWQRWQRNNLCLRRYCLLTNVKTSTCILHIIYGRPLLAMAFLPFVGLLFFMCYVLCVTSYKLQVTSYKK